MSGSALLLKILTPDRILLESEVEDMTAPGTVGEFGVLPDHINFVTSLTVGEVSYRQGERRRYLAIGGGFAEVLNNVVTLLVASAESAETIDAHRALESRNRARALLEKLDPQDAKFALLEAEWALEETRLQIASKAAR
jgi:F-type H+-transporting ATPase subunit epsilon